MQSIQSSWQITCSLFCFSESFTRVIIMHLGVEGCVALARRRFATIACRRLFRRIKTRCTVCKRFDGPSGSEVSPPLPVDRVTLQRPFSVVGIDHAGPLVAKISGARRKVWILLVVCAATRAVNLKLVSSKGDSTDQDNVHLTGFDSNNEAIGNSLFSSLSFPSLFLCICFFF